MKKLKTTNEILRTVNREKPYEVYSGDIADLPNHLRGPHTPLPAIKKYYVAPHYDTDSWVGLVVYYLGTTPVCYSYQQGRKSDEIFTWVSEEAYDSVHHYAESLVSIEGDKYAGLAFIDDLNEEANTYYQVTYSSELITKEGYYEGELVKVTKTWESYSKEDMAMWKKVEINNDKVIPLNEFYIPFDLVEE